MSTLIGFIGQGWIGRHYADDFVARGYEIVRYARRVPYNANKERIAACDITFIAVPTPTTPDGFDDHIVREVLPLIGKGKTAVIKSTLLPGTTKELQSAFPEINVLHSPEFLVEKTAAHDAAHPNRNIVGIPVDTPVQHAAAKAVLAILPQAPYASIMDSTDAELVKYAGNCFLFTKVVFMNLLYDLARSLGADFAAVREAFIHDPRVGESHTLPVHHSGRGAGGHCFIKDFEAFRRLYTETGDTLGSELLLALATKNLALLRESGKDAELVAGVYGTAQPSEKAKSPTVIK